MPRHWVPVLTGRKTFKVGECMSSAWLDENNEMHWATYCPSMENTYYFDADWKLTEDALGYISKSQRERQAQIPKEEYRTDLYLLWYREQAIRIGALRYALLNLRHQQCKDIDRMLSRASSNLTIEMPE